MSAQVYVIRRERPAPVVVEVAPAVAPVVVVARRGWLRLEAEVRGEMGRLGVMPDPFVRASR